MPTQLFRCNSFADTTDGKIILFAGDTTDDYGISRLNVNFKIDGAGEPKNMTILPLKNNAGAHNSLII